VPGANDVVKRLVLGRALRSDRQSEQELPKRLALPIFASDPLSSVTYATQELLVVLTLGGLAYLYLTPYLAAGVVVLLTVVVLSYRQLVKAYPTGGGDYEVASKNLGKGAGRRRRERAARRLRPHRRGERLGRRRQHHQRLPGPGRPPGRAGRWASSRSSPP
jgi:amino acid transporter